MIDPTLLPKETFLSKVKRLSTPRRGAERRRRWQRRWLGGEVEECISTETDQLPVHRQVWTMAVAAVVLVVGFMCTHGAHARLDDLSRARCTAACMDQQNKNQDFTVEPAVFWRFSTSPKLELGHLRVKVSKYFADKESRIPEFPIMF
ncbi:hypothetical protein J6590_039981 [Homalodisca vitripennis]|nr:hypothetical protein J6590_039981 [Homalodisca vitripennis]